MQVTPHVYTMHIEDGAISHPGGSNNYFVGDPNDEMVLVDTGDHHRSWTREIIDYYEQLGSPKITAIVVTHGHYDHIGGIDRLHDAVNAPSSTLYCCSFIASSPAYVSYVQANPPLI